MVTRQTDIAIVGGGIVGSVLACGLSQKTGFKVTLIDAASGPGQSPFGFDARVIALARRTVDALSDMDIALSQANAQPIASIQVTDQGAAGSCLLSASDFGLASFGEVVALEKLGALLHTRLASSNVDILAPARVTDAQQQQHSVALSLDNGEQLQARLVVVADGGRSGLGAMLGIERQSEAYDQTAIICNVTTSEPHNNRAYERFTQSGPLAFLPFNRADNASDKSFSVVWTIPHNEAETLLACEDSVFIRQLQRAFGYRQGRIEKISQRYSYPLALEQAQALTSHRVAVVGNAAQALHPIAGQGFNLGLRDVLGLIDTLSNARDPGAYTCLRGYQQQRHDDRGHTIWLTDSLVRSFSNRLAPLVAGRNAGLIALDNLPALQRAFVRRTTGYGPATKGF